MSSIYAFATWEQYIIYLRKSRQDDPNETVEEVLEKHETMLQEYAVREFGHKIPEKNIYREVVSGESISEREEIKQVLARISDPNIKGVIVVEPSRLSRGDLSDCGRLIDELRYSKTQVVTPYMTYDLDNKMERKFFQDELLRGNDYLEYTKEILWRGRELAPFILKGGQRRTKSRVQSSEYRVQLSSELYAQSTLSARQLYSVLCYLYSKSEYTPPPKSLLPVPRIRERDGEQCSRNKWCRPPQ